MRDVCRFSLDFDGQLAGACHLAARAGRDGALGKLRPEVQTVDARDVMLFQNPTFAQGVCAAGRLLGGLENQKHVARLPHPDPREVFGK